LLARAPLLGARVHKRVVAVQPAAVPARAHGVLRQCMYALVSTPARLRRTECRGSAWPSGSVARTDPA
jgi:hypothetical protein